jgi:hypothetical protein
MKGKLALIITGLLLAGLFMLFDYWMERPYVTQTGAWILYAALWLLLVYPCYRFARLFPEPNNPHILTLIFTTLFAWVLSWAPRLLAVAYFSETQTMQATIIGVKDCDSARIRGIRFCACDTKWTLRLPDGSRHKVCTHRASEHSRIPVNTPVTVTVRDSVFDRSIE